MRIEKYHYTGMVSNKMSYSGMVLNRNCSAVIFLTTQCTQTEKYRASIFTYVEIVRRYKYLGYIGKLAKL